MLASVRNSNLNQTIKQKIFFIKKSNLKIFVNYYLMYTYVKKNKNKKLSKFIINTVI